MKYILRADEPFRGHCQSVLAKDGTVAYTDGLTVEQYAQERGFPVRVVGDAEFDSLLSAHYDTLRTKPKRISKERWWEMLEVLPPCRWHSVNGAEVFHVSERLTGDLVSWFAQKNGRYYEFTQDASISDEALETLLNV